MVMGTGGHYAGGGGRGVTLAGGVAVFPVPTYYRNRG